MPIGTDSDNLVVTLTSRTSHLVVERPTVPTPSAELETSRVPEGVIYTNVGDMPSLERLLAEHRIASAIFERTVPAKATPGRGAVAAAAVLATLVPAVGWTLLAVSLDGGSTPPAMVTLALALGGLILFASMLVALRAR